MLDALCQLRIQLHQHFVVMLELKVSSLHLQVVSFSTLGQFELLFHLDALLDEAVAFLKHKAEFVF